MSGEEQRRGELVAGAAVGGLEPHEQAEVDALVAADPEAARELEEFRAVLAALPPRGEGWESARPSAALRERVMAATIGASGGAAHPGGDRTDVGPERVAEVTELAPRRRRTAAQAALAAAAAGVLVGAVGALGVSGLADRPPEGGPGTLGAVEQVDVVGEPPGVTVDASVVAHTWGTETVVDVDGLDDGEDYLLVVLDAAGEPVASGGFVGAADIVECRLNAPVLREDATRLEVLDEDGDLVMAADLPAV
ncbi:hypothetical protein [Pseudokineococcus sp. 1T1Z-3]|uniref:hypothetical protein n=1 Tax=Pseudokineococcus sp. 1T1Z-3 TaxID=3132745 RepID=UPI0030B72C4F